MATVIVRRGRRRWKMALAVFIFVLTGCCAALYFCNRAVVRSAEGKLYDDVNYLPFRKTALLLGTGKWLANGHQNPYHTYRIEAAAAVMNAGKARCLVISGDNGQAAYNEPADMRADLIAAGVDSTHIVLDYAGFRTFDSMVRLHAVFGQDSVTVISQPFHNERALYIASRESIAAIGFNARDVAGSRGTSVQLRERLARVKLFIDYLFGKSPKYLGPRVQLPE